MATWEIEDKVFEVDGDGFLADPDIWNEEVARLNAKSDGIEDMNDKHWAIINIIRQNFEEKDTNIVVTNRGGWYSADVRAGVASEMSKDKIRLYFAGGWHRGGIGFINGEKFATSASSK